MIPRLEWAKRLKKVGDALGREGMSQRVLEIMSELMATPPSYKEAMVVVGRLKAIAAAAKCDDYWSEQVDSGFHLEMRHLSAEIDRISALASQDRQEG